MGTPPYHPRLRVVLRAKTRPSGRSVPEGVETPKGVLREAVRIILAIVLLGALVATIGWAVHWL